ncbi:hypothetical protein D9757_000231 [Collybiopsis confluens]|uniref:Uncharacterized protein n=1 Tax=Collybiopsis confluens TaxID=2823264 RepID=A0A8H5I4L7_9AGAR|nr:hypothetical protein D9757_000231 [Collybiopsis confluens]
MAASLASAIELIPPLSLLYPRAGMTRARCGLSATRNEASPNMAVSAHPCSSTTIMASQNTPSLVSTLNIFASPWFGDECPDIVTFHGLSSIVAPTASLLDHAVATEEHTIQSIDPGSLDQDTTASSAIRINASFTPEEDAFIDFNSSMIECNPDHTFSNGQSSLSSSQMLHEDPEESSNETIPIAQFDLVPALSSSFQLPASEPDNVMSVSNSAADIVELPPGHPELPCSPPEALLFSSAIANDSSITGTMLLEPCDSPDDDLVQHLVLEPLPLIIADQPSFPVKSQDTTPPAPRLPLATLPDFEPLTLMHDLLSSLSQNQPVVETEPMSEGLPSSSPPDGLEAPTSSSPPSSSPSELFLSSPLRISGVDQPVIISRRGTPLAFLSRETSINEHEIHQADSDTNSKIVSRTNPITRSSSPPVSSPVVSALSSPKESCQDLEIEIEIPPKVSYEDYNNKIMLPIHSSDNDLAFHNLDIDHPTSDSQLPMSSPIPSSSPHDETRVPVPQYSSPGHQISMALSSPPRKRERDYQDEGSQSLPGSPSEKHSTPAPPAPKRPTLASQRRQKNKLTTPFKSPLMMKKPKIDAEENVPFNSVAGPEAALPKKAGADISLPEPPKQSEIRKHYTARAAAQFKSPLSGEVSVSSDSQVRLTPTMQALERKIQILKRALKVKKDNEEETLTNLTTRWTEAGREVAWEVWQLTKDGDHTAFNEKRPFSESWGWDAQADGKRIKLEGGDGSWGWSINGQAEEGSQSYMGMKEESMDDEKVEYTMGMMLRRFGIDPATLGWDEQEGIFQDS